MMNFKRLENDLLEVFTSNPAILKHTDILGETLKPSDIETWENRFPGFFNWREALSAFSGVEADLLTTVLLWRWFGSRLVVSFRIVDVLSLTISFRLWGLCAVKVVKYDFSWNGLFSDVNIYIFSSPMAASSSHWRLGLEVSKASWSRCWWYLVQDWSLN